MNKPKLLSCLAIGLFMFCRTEAQFASPNYEFRGVWVATVENIDWPSRKTLSVADQKAEYLRLLDMHQKNGMNVMIVQVRPSGDAMYRSPYEPWSEYLTGKQGLQPSPLYDPLPFMIEETHKRGMEFHAWINPYRAVFNLLRSSIAPNHLTKTHPGWFLSYGNSKLFNPALPEVRDHVAKIVKDLVARYDIDGIHLDDYFYPYPVNGKDFPDDKDYRKYGNGLSKGDWRRSNCDSIIFQLHNVIRSTKPHVKFGVSPFCVWRNKSQDPMGSDTRAGLTNYDNLYADILLWLQKGWVDYVVPQLYRERFDRLVDYNVILKWWNDHSYGRNLYIGHGIYRAGTNAAWRDPNEIPKEIEELRKYPTTQGSAYFSSSSFAKNPNGWNDSLQNHYYHYPALVPAMPWIDNSIPVQPLLEKLENSQVKLVYKGDEKIKGFGILLLPQGVEEKFNNAQLVYMIVAEKMAVIDLSKITGAAGKRVFAVTVDGGNNVSPMIELK